MRLDRPLLLILAALVAGCADPEPFVDWGHSVSPTVAKPADPVVSGRGLPICYSDKTPREELDKLAAERCATHGLQAVLINDARYQCRATSPHRATYLCYDPEMRTAKGGYINPFDEQAVREWEQRTGKKARPHNFMTGPSPANRLPTAPAINGDAPGAASPADQPPPPAAITPAPAAPVRPLTPADIAGKPPIPDLPPREEAPPPAPVPVQPNGSGFTLPQGSWGDHFQD